MRGSMMRRRRIFPMPRASSHSCMSSWPSSCGGSARRGQRYGAIPSGLNADQFEPRIEQAISDSSILLVVLSKNWISRPYCVRELESFAERWKADGGLRERIVVAAKREVDPDRRPSLLQGQVGIKFYALDEPEESICAVSSKSSMREAGFATLAMKIESKSWQESCGAKPTATANVRPRKSSNLCPPRVRNRDRRFRPCAPTAGPSSSQSPPMTCTRRMIA